MSEFINDDKVKADFTIWKMLVRFWPYMKRHKFWLLLILISIAMYTFAARTLPYLFGQAVEKVFSTNNKEILLTYALIYLGFEITKAVFQIAYQFQFQKFGNRVLYYLREDMVKHLQKLPIKYFDKTPVGRTVTRLTNDISNLGDLFTDSFISVLIETITLFAILVVLFSISWKLALATMIVTPLFFYLSIKLSYKMRDVLRESKKKLSELNSFVAENFSGIKVIQLNNRLDKNSLRFGSLSAEYASSILKSIRTNALLHPVMNLFNAITISIALYYGGFLTTQNILPIGLMITFILNVQDFIPPMREILEKYQQFQNSLTSAERVFQLFDEKPEDYIESINQFSSSEILIKNLNFKYESELPLVLKNINLHIPEGHQMALVGRTGSGKSTFISLLQGFYPAPANTIFIGSQSIESINKSKLRTLIGVVQQDNFIFKGTIAENVSLRRSDISIQKITDCLNKIGYLDFLTKTNRDINSKVEERGANLSVGERQLLAFARILAFNPEILILDEATANIDSETEQIIQKAVLEVTKNRTSIIIAHRLSTIRHCHSIVVLDQGQIVEMGTFNELMNKKGHYYELENSNVKMADA